MYDLWIVVFGGIGNGFEFFGPFRSVEEARRYAELDGEIVPLQAATRATQQGSEVVSLQWKKD